MVSNRLTKVIAAGCAALVLAASGISIASSNSGNGTTTTTTVPAAPRKGANAPPQNAATADAQVAKSGKLPAGWTPGSGTLITGAAADKAKAVATAKYPGTVNRVLQLDDGSYAVHLFATSGVHHVFVSKDFKITGTA